MSDSPDLGGRPRRSYGRRLVQRMGLYQFELAENHLIETHNRLLRLKQDFIACCEIENRTAQKLAFKELWLKYHLSLHPFPEVNAFWRLVAVIKRLIGNSALVYSEDEYISSTEESDIQSSDSSDEELNR